MQHKSPESLFLSIPEQFRADSHSVARRVRDEECEKIGCELAALPTSEPDDEGLKWLDLTTDSTDKEIEAACRELDEHLAAAPPRSPILPSNGRR